MNFDFSDDQRRLQEEVNKVLTAHSTSEDVRQVLEGKAPYSTPVWQQLAALGVLGANIPEQCGGSGLGQLELCLFAEEIGRAMAAVPMLSTIYLAAEAIRRAGSEAQQGKWLPRLADGSTIATAVLAPSPAEWVLAAQPLSLANGRLTGTLNAVPDGMAAHLCVVSVGGQLLLVDLAAPGVARTSLTSLDPTKPLARVAFNNVEAEVLGSGDHAQTARDILNGAAVLLAFEQIGGAERALYAARDYVLERKTFGRVVGSYQAVKHKLADIYTAIEIARAHAYYGAWALANGAPELPRAAAAARVAATTAYNLAAEESLHLHGGIGFTWEMDCHIHLRRARWLGQIIGSEHRWRSQLATSLIEEAA